MQASLFPPKSAGIDNGVEDNVQTRPEIELLKELFEKQRLENIELVQQLDVLTLSN